MGRYRSCARASSEAPLKLTLIVSLLLSGLIGVNAASKFNLSILGSNSGVTPPEKRQTNDGSGDGAGLPAECHGRLHTVAAPDELSQPLMTTDTSHRSFVTGRLAAALRTTQETRRRCGGPTSSWRTLESAARPAKRTRRSVGRKGVKVGRRMLTVAVAHSPFDATLGLVIVIAGMMETCSAVKHPFYVVHCSM